MLTVLRNATYARLFSAQVIALLGTGLLTVALGLLAFDLAGDAAGSVLGTALTIKMVAYVGVAPLIAAVVDRLPKKAVLVTADLVRLLIACLLPFVTETWQIFVLVFVLQSASATFTPAFQSLIPSVLPSPRDYTRALSLSRLAYDLESLLSPTLAALLLTVISYNNLFVGTAVGFAASAALVLSSRLPARSEEPVTSTFWQRIPLGLQVFARTRTLQFLMLTNVAVAAGTAIVMVNTVVYTRGALDLDASGLALTLAAYGVGSLIVAVNVPWLADRIGVITTMIARDLGDGWAYRLSRGDRRRHRNRDRLGMAAGDLGGAGRGHLAGEYPLISAAGRRVHAREPEPRLHGTVRALPRLLPDHLPDRGMARRRQPHHRRDRPRHDRDPGHRLRNRLRRDQQAARSQRHHHRPKTGLLDSATVTLPHDRPR